MRVHGVLTLHNYRDIAFLSKGMELKLPFLTLVCQRIILTLERLWTEPTGQRKKHWMMVRKHKYLTTVLIVKQLIIIITVTV